MTTKTNRKTKSSSAIIGKRGGTLLGPNIKRTIPQFFMPNWDRVESIVDRVVAMSDAERQTILKQIDAQFKGRHSDLNAVLMRHFERVYRYLDTFELTGPLSSASEDTKHLIGAYFTKEYTVGAAALCNPSIVPHPDQTHLNVGEIRVILSLRAVGEGHISSLQFCSGIIDKDNRLIVDEISPIARTPKIVKNPLFSKKNFRVKLDDLAQDRRIVELVLKHLPDPFSFRELHQTMRQVSMNHLYSGFFDPDVLKAFDWVSRSNYEIEFDEESTLSERVIFPASENDKNGIEDVRFVKFSYGDDRFVYYGTYTAYNGHTILPQIIETSDFLNFRMRTVSGPVARNKGMALFPRKIDGNYVMLSRQDGVGLYIMSSDRLTYWEDATLLKMPTFPWEFVQIGNCASPIETEKGWLVMVHGVGPIRRYCLGVILLDLDDPTRILGELDVPLMEPTEEERNGYVPNVLYSCGAMVHQGNLILPYAFSDYAIRYASFELESLLAALLSTDS